MLPPNGPGHRPPNSSSPAGATATRPSIGARGTVIDFIWLLGRSSGAGHALAIEPPHVAAGAGTGR